MRVRLPGTLLAAILICGCSQPSPETMPHPPNQYTEASSSEQAGQDEPFHTLTAAADDAPHKTASRPSKNWQYD